MCVVSYTYKDPGFILAHNRDENIQRSQALPPRQSVVSGQRLIYPLDPQSNGTWILMQEDGKVFCLLNGAFDNFVHQPQYKKSRGELLLKMAGAEDSQMLFEQIELNEFAPFTVIAASQRQLWELRWDGNNRFCLELDHAESYVWDSATLYDHTQRSNRINRFNESIKSIDRVSVNDVNAFHLREVITEPGNKPAFRSGLSIETVSITIVSVTETLKEMQYHDCVNRSTFKTGFPNKTNAGKAEEIFQQN